MKEVTQLVLARRTKMCNFLEYRGELASSLLPPGWVRSRGCRRSEGGSPGRSEEDLEMETARSMVLEYPEK